MILSDLLKATRQYFWNLDFTEVEASYLNKSLPLEPNLYTFRTKDFYLPASPEFALKKYLAQNPKNCFSLAHCFRDLESTSHHHFSEFLMLEYYLVNQNIADLQKSLKKYLSKFLDLKFLNLKLPSTNFSHESDFNHFFLNEIEPTLPKDAAVFITGYPAFLSPLAKNSPDEKDIRLSLRFELYINGIEIANGCEENRNSDQILHAFQTEKKYRLKNHLPLHPYSLDFVKNSASLPPCSGVGLGLDRLLMVINQRL